MEIKKIHLVYFSPTYGTKKILQYVAEGLSGDAVEEYDITQEIPDERTLKADELLVVGVPVYSGRIPVNTIALINKFKGNSSPTIIVCVYGNREYDDALLELKNLTETSGFKVISAGAFIAELCIFPQVANNRPDETDKAKAVEFGQTSMKLLTETENINSLPEIIVKGNFPYRETKNIPLKPKGNRYCNQCGICVRLCPARAIDEKHPRKTDKTKCISCARCIVVCPQNARHFGGLLYRIASKKFLSAYSARKEPETTYAINN